MKSKSLGTDLTVGHVGKQLIIFAIPFMFANLLQTLYNMVDAVIVGQFVGANGLSAVSSCGELIQFYTFIAIGFGGAGQTLIGQFVGAGKKDRLNRTIGTLFTLLLGMAVLVSVFCRLTWKWQLNLINLPEEALSSGRDYFLICTFGMLFIFGYNLVSSILRGMGDSKHPLIFIAIASVSNLVLDLLFVAVFHMGTAGAALATILGQALSFLCALVYLYRNREQFGFDFKAESFLPDGSLVSPLMKLGIPMSAQGALISISMLYVYSMINGFGVAASAANGIQLKLANVNRIITNSMGTAGAATIAQCIGAGKYDRAKSVFNWTLVITLAYALLYSALLILFPGQIFSLFSRDQAVLAFASTACLFSAGDNFGGAFRSPCNSMVNGTGAAILGLVSSIMDGVIARIGLSILFGNVIGMGIKGYWLGNMLAGYVSVAILLPFVLSGAWKKKKLDI